MSVETTLTQRGRRERRAQISQQSTVFLLKPVCPLLALIDEDEVVPFAVNPSCNPFDSVGLCRVSAELWRCIDAAVEQEINSRHRIHL